MKKNKSKLVRIKPRGAVNKECPSGGLHNASLQLTPMERWHRLKEHIVREGESILYDIAPDEGPLWSDELVGLLTYIHRPDAFERP